MKIKSIKTIKTAMPVPMPSAEERQRMLQDDYAVAPYTGHSPQSVEHLPYTGKSELAKLLQDKTFDGLDPKTVLQLPTIHKLDRNMMVEINGDNYYIVHVVPSKEVGRKSVYDGVEYVKGDRYAGKIVAIRATDGEAVEFPYDETVDKIRMPQELKEETARNMNEKIRAYNSKLEKINQASGMTRLNLQIVSAEQDIEERVETLVGMINSVKEKQNNPADMSAHDEWIQRIFTQVENREISLVDAFHTISYMYMDKPEELIQDIENSSINIPDEIKNALISMAHQEIRNREQNIEKQRQETINREQRKEEEWSEDTIEEKPIGEISDTDIPGGSYKKLPSYVRPEKMQGSLHKTITGLQKDLQELTAVGQALQSLRNYIGDLEKGQRSNSYMQSKEGQEIVDNIILYLNEIQAFSKRYKENIIQDGTINPKLFGTNGKSLGNALLAITLKNIIVIIYNTIKPFIQNNEVDQTTTDITNTEMHQENQEERQARKTHDLTKMSMNEEMWNNFTKLYKKSSLELDSEMPMTKNEIADEKYGMKGITYDTALPQSWVNECAEKGFDVRPHFVWIYEDGNTLGKPGPVTQEGEKMTSLPEFNATYLTASKKIAK